ncbi:MAG TPA: hypothetical protein VNL14_15150 [Candidatus Acidoferrales bacterium]|nr:hypothetical protein [Candidatus Acidoferrales bacterium]
MKLGILFAAALLLVGAAGKSFGQEEKKKAKDLEAVISAVGQRTITFQYERKEKVREAVVGIDENTNIERDGAKIKLKDLQQGDKVVIKYEPEAYTPAISVKVIGKGEVKKVGGGE